MPENLARIHAADKLARPGAAVTIAKLAALVGGTVRVSSDGSAETLIRSIKPLELAGPADLTFLAPTTERNATRLRNLAVGTRAGAVLIREFSPEIQATQIVCENPLLAVSQLAAVIHPAPETTFGIHPTAVVHPSAQLADGVSIGPLSVVGENVVIGERTVIHPQVVIYAGATIGRDCIVHSGAVIREHVSVGDDCVLQNGAVIGGDGFGYVSVSSSGPHRIPHVGTVILESHVDVGANTTIDRATLGQTLVQQGTKIDNLVMIGHNVQLGQRNILCGQVGISGSVNIGDDCILGGQVGVADHVNIGDRVKVSAKSGISGNTGSNVVLAGYPAQPIAGWRRREALLNRLPDLLKKLTGRSRSAVE